MNKNNEYDQIKGMLNKLRTFNSPSKKLREQVEYEPNGTSSSYTNDNSDENTDSDINVINNVDVKVNSDDHVDLTLKDDEKGKISQLIDDFKREVSETVVFGTFDIYDNSSKLNGKIGNSNVDFILSGGDEQGLYITASMLKIDEETLDLISKLKIFENKFLTVTNELINNRI